MFGFLVVHAVAVGALLLLQCFGDEEHPALTDLLVRLASLLSCLWRRHYSPLEAAAGAGRLHELPPKGTAVGLC